MWNADYVSTLMCVLVWVCDCVVPLSTNEVFSISLLDMYLHVFLAFLVRVCMCLCHGVHWQTNRRSREISEIVPVPSYNHTYKYAYLCVYICFLFVSFSEYT